MTVEYSTTIHDRVFTLLGKCTKLRYMPAHNILQLYYHGTIICNFPLEQGYRLILGRHKIDGKSVHYMDDTEYAAWMVGMSM